MDVIKLKILLLIVCLTGVSAACRGGNFQTRPEDEVIKIERSGESPKGTDRDYKIGDQVAFIGNDGRLTVGYSIDKICEKLIFASANLDGMEKWMPSEQTSSYDREDIEKTASKGYRVVSGGRSNYYEWFPSEQIFPAPWANNVNLKIGDIVYQKKHGFSDMRKGVVTELPVKSSDDFRGALRRRKHVNRSSQQRDFYFNLSGKAPRLIARRHRLLQRNDVGNRYGQARR